MNLALYRAEYADYHRSVAGARYQYDSGKSDELNIAEINDRYGDLFSGSSIADLKAEFERTPAHLETQRAAIARLLAWSRSKYVESQVREQTDEINACERSSSVTWDGRRIRQRDVPLMLTLESDAVRQQTLAATWFDRVTFCDDLRIERLRAKQSAAKELGFDSYSQFSHEAEAIDFDRLRAQTETFLTQTDAVYSTAMSAYSSLASRDEVGALTFAYSLPQETLPQNDGVELFTATAAGFGSAMSTARTEAARDLGKSKCYSILPPDDVRLLVSNRCTGADLIDTMSAAGEAQHQMWASRELAAQYPEFVLESTNAVVLGFGYLFANLLLDEKWLEEFWPRKKSINRLASDFALLTMFRMRRLAAELQYARLLEGTLPPREQLQSAFTDLLERATAFRISSKLYLLNCPDRNCAAAHLRGFSFAVALAHYLRERHGHRWWRASKAGDELRDLSNTASRHTVEELANLIGFGVSELDIATNALNLALKGKTA